MSPFLAMKILNISSSASDRSSLFFRRNRSLYFLYNTLKLSQKTRCTILMCLGQEDCSPSILGLFAYCAAKLLKKLVVSCSDSFDWEIIALSSRPQRNYLLKKSVKTLRFCGKWSNFYRRPRRCLQMQAETKWFRKRDSNRTSSSSYSVPKIAQNLFLYP